ncbi:MAG: CsbD family protein [Actinomycetes bacterium]
MSTVVDKVKTSGNVVRGRAVALRGMAKELTGKLTGNRRLQVAGMADQGKGRFSRAIVRVKPAIDKVTGLVRRNS